MSDYAGELTLDQAWQLLGDDPASVLIDVRTEAEWNFVGVPVLDGVSKQARFVQWVDYPSGQPNAAFAEQAIEGLEPGQPILLLCRSGGRSLAAARALTAAGYGPAYNVSTGFEGDLDQDGHRRGGWKGSLPWRQG